MDMPEPSTPTTSKQTTESVAQSMVPTQIADQFLAQGLIGAVAFGLLLCVIYLYRRTLTMQTDRETEVASIRATHALDMAAERKTNSELQQQRIDELKTALAAITASAETVQQVTDAFKDRPEPRRPNPRS